LGTHGEALVSELNGTFHLTLDNQILFAAQITIDLDGRADNRRFSRTLSGFIGFRLFPRPESRKDAAIFMGVSFVSLEHSRNPPVIPGQGYFKRATRRSEGQDYIRLLTGKGH
jgi:hypothetical protein